MRIAVLTTKFHLDSSNYLTNLLVTELENYSEEIDVYLLDWSKNPIAGNFTLNKKVFVRSVDPNIYLFGKRSPFKWYFGSLLSALKLKNIPEESYDLLIGFSPLAAVFFMVNHLRKRSTKSYLIYWDFFPAHQGKVGKLSGKFLLQFLTYLESLAMKNFDHIGLMSPQNKLYFSRYYKNIPSKLHILPVWGTKNISVPYKDDERIAIRRHYGLPTEKKIAVFGGQIASGRGIEQILSVAKELEKTNQDVIFLFVGDGDLSYLVKESKLKNILYLGPLAQDKYFEILRSCDVGIVFTQNISEISSFPSKTIDYVRFQIPICACVENDSDYIGIIQDELGVGLCCSYSNIDMFKINLIRLIQDEILANQIKANCVKSYLNYFSVERTAQKILKQAGF
jgi:glycosyltransferase involved in cell wall biosynthesis